MPSFETIHHVPYSPAQMYDLVADVEKYPQFLPLCSDLKIRSRRDKGSKTMLVADMTVAYKMVRETFASQVLLKPDDLAIDVQYLEGPFKYLDNQWRFVAKGDGGQGGNGTDIVFKIDYEFKSRALGLLMGSMFDYAFRKFTSAFEARAREIYGDGGSHL